MSSTINPDQLGDELDAILSEYLHTSFEKRQEALQAGAEVLKSALEQNAPRGATGGLAGSFRIKTKYKNARYVGSTKTVKSGDKQIPLTRIIERKRPFMRPTFEANTPRIYDAIKNKLT